MSTLYANILVQVAKKSKKCINGKAVYLSICSAVLIFIEISEDKVMITGAIHFNSVRFLCTYMAAPLTHW